MNTKEKIIEIINNNASGHYRLASTDYVDELDVDNTVSELLELIIKIKSK